MTQHTPGPWTCSANYSTRHYMVWDADGNDNGETVITDYTTNLEPQLQAVNAYAETFV